MAYYPKDNQEYAQWCFDRREAVRLAGSNFVEELTEFRDNEGNLIETTVCVMNDGGICDRFIIMEYLGDLYRALI